MKRILLLLLLAVMLISVGCNCSKEWQVYPEDEIRNRAAIKLDKTRGYSRRMYK
ncbi:hypothetical protein LCGC14_2237820 [marine sediment metagenome]|uniref:Uncharacterized protein n=1 Tax=marine sediment metagenome TaxID=412755 RepID=A0A0F9D6H2_9ZZZZ